MNKSIFKSYLGIFAILFLLLFLNACETISDNSELHLEEIDSNLENYFNLLNEDYNEFNDNFEINEILDNYVVSKGKTLKISKKWEEINEDIENINKRI